MTEAIASERTHSLHFDWLANTGKRSGDGVLAEAATWGAAALAELDGAELEFGSVVVMAVALDSNLNQISIAAG